MIPPKRTTKSTRSKESEASVIYCKKLKPLGWRYSGRGSRDDWSFIPGSLLKATSPGKVFRHGTRGIHYAEGWSGLADMVNEYGENYAPTLQLFPQQGRSSDASLADSSSNNNEVFDDNETASFPSGKSTNNQHEDIAAANEKVDDYDSERTDTEVTNEPNTREEDDEPVYNTKASFIDDDPMPTDVDDGTIITENDTSAVSENNNEAAMMDTEGDESEEYCSKVANVVDTIKKCREELALLTATPGFHSPREIKACQDELWITIRALYSELANYNKNNKSH